MNPEQAIPTKRPNKLSLFFKGIQLRIASSPRAYLAYCFLIPVALMYLIYLAMEIHPFGDGTVLVLDLNGQYVYFHEGLRHAIYGDASFLYTFCRSLGGEFLGIYVYYLASPLTYLVALFPQGAIQEALLIIILLKVGLCGLSFGFYLHKHTLHPNKPITVAFAILYALCAYAVVYQNNLMWIDALIWLPLLTYAIEQLIRNRRYKLFVISLTMTVMSNYYIGYMVCLYVALYFFYYLYANPTQITNPHGEKMHRLRAFLRIALFSVLALAISAIILVAALYSLSFGKSDFSKSNWLFEAKFDFLDFFTKFLPGSYDTVRPEGLPLVYCGLLTLILLPVYFLSGKIRSREKIASLLFIAFFVLSFIAKPLDLIWHGFQAPNWLNYRYSFMLSFFLLILAYKAIGNLRRVGAKLIFCISIFLILFAAVCDKLEFETYLTTSEALLNLETVWLTIIATVAILFVLCLFLAKKNPKARSGLAAVLVAVVCMEVFCNGLTAFVQLDRDVAFSSYSSYDNYIGQLREVVEDVQEKDPSFYRMEKLSHRKYNDNMALNMRGLSGSTSTLNAETIQFLKYMGLVSRSHLSQYRGGNPVSDSLLGIKYVIDQESSEKLAHYYTPYVTDEKYTAYQNPFALSIAYGVDASVADFIIDSYDTYFERFNGMIGTMRGDENGSEIFRSAGAWTTELSKYCEVHQTGARQTYSSNSETGTATATFTILAPETAEYYFYAPPTANPEETKIAVNDVPFGKYLGSNYNHIVSLGYFEKGATIDVTLTFPNEEKVTLYDDKDYFWYIDEATFRVAFDDLADNPQFLIDENYTEDHLTGTIATVENDQMIQTTIPYDEGWKVYVDGEQVAVYKTMEALLAFDIAESGSHTLELKYSPEIYGIGVKLSLIGLAAFLLICLADWILLRKRRQKYPDAYAAMEEHWELEDFDEDYEAMLALPPDAPKEKQSIKDEMRELLALFVKSKAPAPSDDTEPTDALTSEAEETHDANDSQGEN